LLLLLLLLLLPLLPLPLLVLRSLCFGTPTLAPGGASNSYRHLFFWMTDLTDKQTGQINFING
jgi:hypothetical protein